MIGQSYFHSVAKLSKRYLGLAAIQVAVAIPNVMANNFVLVYLDTFTRSMTLCALFITTEVLSAILLLLFTSKWIALNIEKSLTLSLVALACYYGMLGLLSGPFLFLAAPLFGAYIVLFWVPYQTLVTYIVDKSHRGIETAAYFAVFPLVSVVAPILGGLTINALGFHTVFLVASAYLLIVYLIIRTVRTAAPRTFNIRLIDLLMTLRLATKGRIDIDLDTSIMKRRLKVSLFSQGIQESVFWIAVPLAGIIMAGNVEGLGKMLSLFALTGAFMTVMLGFASDQIKRRTIFARIGALVAGLACLFIGLHQSVGPYEFGFSCALAYLTMPLVSVFLFIETTETFAIECKRGILIRELLLNSGRLTGGILTIGLSLLGLQSIHLFLIAGTSMAIIAFVR